MKLKDIKSVFGSKKNDQLKIRSKKDKIIKRKLTSTMSKKLNRMNGIICDPAKSVGLETELTLSPAITVHYTSKIVDVAKVMSVKDNTTCVLVIDDRGQLCGILTDKDIVFRVLATGMDPKRTAVHTVMTANPVTATLETAKKVAMQAIYTGSFWHIPIISETDSSSVVKTNVIGMINLNELFGRDIIEKLQQIPSFMEFSSSAPSASDNSFARSTYSEIDMISRYEEIRQQKLTVVLDQHEESPPEIDGKMNVSIASNIMKIYKKGAVIVCDTDTRSLLGILTTQDLILRVVAAGRYPAATSVKSVMTPNPPVVNPNRQVSKTLQYMLDNNYKYIVIGADLKITGIVDILEVTRAALQQLQDRDEIEEDARSRRSFSEMGSYYESNSRVIQRSSSRSSLSFDNSDRAVKPFIRDNMSKENSNFNGNILDALSDDENDNDKNDLKILPREVSLMNNHIIPETIPEIDEEKEAEERIGENSDILNNLNSVIEEEPEIVYENNMDSETRSKSTSHQLDELAKQHYDNEDIPADLPVINVKLDPDMDIHENIESNNYEQDIIVEQITEPNEINNNDIENEEENEDIIPHELETGINEIILPNDIEDHVNEVIEGSEIDTNINDSNVIENTMNNLNEPPEIIDTMINTNNEMVETNEIENEIVPREVVVDSTNTNDLKPEDLIEIKGNDIEKDGIEIEDNTNFENIELENVDINNNSNNNTTPEFVVNNEFENAQIETTQTTPAVIPEFVISNDFDQEIQNINSDDHQFQNIPRELAMIEESINHYNMDHLAPVSTKNTHNKKDIATFDALLEIEVNDEGIHNMDGNNTIYDMDDFVVSNNNLVEDEQNISEEAKRYVDNIIGTDSNNDPGFEEAVTENLKDNTTEADIYNNNNNNNNNNSNSNNSNNSNLEMINEVTSTSALHNEPEFIYNVSNSEPRIDNKASLEFSDIHVQYSENETKVVDTNKLIPNNDFEINDIYDLSTIMPSSPPMPIENFSYQDRNIPPLDLNNNNSLENSEIHNSIPNFTEPEAITINNNEINNNGFIGNRRSSEYHSNSISYEEIEKDLSTTLQPSSGREDDNQEDGKSAIMETIALNSESNIVLDQNQEHGPVIERGNLLEFKKDNDEEEQQRSTPPPKSILEYIRQIVTPNVISHIFKYSLDKSPLDNTLSLEDNSTTMLVKRVVGGRDLYDEEDRRYNDRDDSSSTVLYPSQYMNTSQKRVSLSRLAATQSIIKEEDLILKCFDQETEQVYRINYNNNIKYEEIVNTIIKKSQIEDPETLLFGYLDEDRDFISIESEEDFLQGIWLARKLLWGRLFIVIKRKHKASLRSILPWGSHSASSNANNDQGNWLSNAMLIGVGVAATLAVKRISS